MAYFIFSNKSLNWLLLEIGDFHKNTEADGYSPNLDHQFVELPLDMGGGTDFATLTDEIALAAGMLSLPLRLVHGEHRGLGNGYGIRHILASDAEEMATEDYWSVQDFVREVAIGFNAIHRETDKPRWLLVRRAENDFPWHRIIVVKLHKSSECYSVITGYLRGGYRKIKEPLVWERRDRSPGPEAPSLR